MLRVCVVVDVCATLLLKNVAHFNLVGGVQGANAASVFGLIWSRSVRVAGDPGAARRTLSRFIPLFLRRIYI